MKIKIYADAAKLEDMLAYHGNGSMVSGFTTNPTLMRNAGITNYELFAKDVLAKITDYPISFEVLSDELPEMERQAKKVASWGQNVYVKIPVINMKGVSTGPVLKNLSSSGVQVNVTAVFTIRQVEVIIRNLHPGIPSIISIFAGRIANAGVDPMPIVKRAVKIAKALPKCEILWASTREAFNVVQAEACGCHIITVPPTILDTLKTFGKDLTAYSLETVQMFYRDAQNAGLTL